MHGRNRAEHDQRLALVLKQLEEAGVEENASSPKIKSEVSGTHHRH